MFELSQNSLSRHAKRVRLAILGCCCTPIIGAYFYNQGYRVPFLGCPIRHLTGIPCPTCGMTRSFMAIASGDWSQAIEQHLFGPIVFGVFLVAIGQSAIELLTGRHLAVFSSQIVKNRKFQRWLLVLYFSYYALRLCGLSISGKLSVDFGRSPLGNLVF